MVVLGQGLALLALISLTMAPVPNVDASRHPTGDCREVDELNGGSGTGSGELIAAGDVDYSRWAGRRMGWNDHTLSWEIIATSRAENRLHLVQQRARSIDFRREYERYRAANERGDNPRGLHNGHDNPAADPAGDVQCN